MARRQAARARRGRRSTRASAASCSRAERRRDGRAGHRTSARAGAGSPTKRAITCRRDQRLVAERDDHLRRAGQRRGAEPQRRRLPARPVLAHDRLGPPKVDRRQQLGRRARRARRRPARAPGRAHCACDRVLEQRPALERREQLRLRPNRVPSPPPGSARDHPGDRSRRPAITPPAPGGSGPGPPPAGRPRGRDARRRPRRGSKARSPPGDRAEIEAERRRQPLRAPRR